MLRSAPSASCNFFILISIMVFLGCISFSASWQLATAASVCWSTPPRVSGMDAGDGLNTPMTRSRVDKSGELSSDSDGHLPLPYNITECRLTWTWCYNICIPEIWTKQWGEFKIVNVSYDILFGTTVGRNHAFPDIEIMRSPKYFLSVIANRKVRWSIRLRTFDFLGIYLQFDYAFLFHEIQSQSTKANELMIE